MSLSPRCLVSTVSAVRHLKPQQTAREQADASSKVVHILYHVWGTDVFVICVYYRCPHVDTVTGT